MLLHFSGAGSSRSGPSEIAIGYRKTEAISPASGIDTVVGLVRSKGGGRVGVGREKYLEPFEEMWQGVRKKMIALTTGRSKFGSGFKKHTGAVNFILCSPTSLGYWERTSNPLGTNRVPKLRGSLLVCYEQENCHPHIYLR